MEEFRARLALKKIIGLGAPVDSIVHYLFPRKSEEERQGILGVMHAAGIRMGSDLHRKTFADLHVNLKLPERVCKVLLDRNLLKQGAPQEILWYGRQSYNLKPQGAHLHVPQQLDDIARSANLDAHKMRGYGRGVSNKTWIQVAQEHMSADEQADALCNPGETEIVYAYRAMLRIISRVLPVNLSLVESSSFMGTLYLVPVSDAADPDSSPDWSRVVWCLQAKPPGMDYFEAMGRLVMGIKLVFAHQPLREFAIGVIGCADVLDTFMFWAEDQKLVEGKLVPVPRSVTNTMLSLHRIHTGVEVLMMFMCAPPNVLGFISRQQAAADACTDLVHGLALSDGSSSAEAYHYEANVSSSAEVNHHGVANGSYV